MLILSEELSGCEILGARDAVRSGTNLLKPNGLIVFVISELNKRSDYYLRSSPLITWATTPRTSRMEDRRVRQVIGGLQEEVVSLSNRLQDHQHKVKVVRREGFCVTTLKPPHKSNTLYWDCFWAVCRCVCGLVGLSCCVYGWSVRYIYGTGREYGLSVV